MILIYYLSLNKAREYIRIIKRMKFSVITIAVVFAVMIMQFYLNIWPSIDGFGYNDKFYKIVIGIIAVSTIIKYIAKKPNINMKPITLHLLQNTDKYKTYYFFKVSNLIVKNVIPSLVLSILVFGGLFEMQVFVTILSMLSSKELVRWILYNKNSRCLSNTACFITVILAVSCLYSNLIILIGFTTITVASYMFCIALLKIDNKYYKEMHHSYELHLAQISGDTKALSKFVEADNNNLFVSNKEEIQHPIIWKTLVSIFRLNYKFLLFAAAFFGISYIVKITKIADNIPILETDIGKNMFVLMTIYFLLQMLIQVFRKEFEKLIDNHKDGLFIPYDSSKLIYNYSVVPVFAIIIVIAILALLLKVNILIAVIEMIIISLIFLTQIILLVKDKKILIKITPVINFIFLASCYLFLL